MVPLALRERAGVRGTVPAVFLLLAEVVLGLAGRSAFGDGQLALTVVDGETHQPIPCRMHLVGPGKQSRRSDPAPFWADHFVFPGEIKLKLPAGHYTFEVERGFEYLKRTGNFTIEHFADDAKEIELRRFVDMSAEGWWSGDLYVRRPLRQIELLMKADDLHLAEVVTWWNGKNDAARSLVPSAPRVGAFNHDRAYEVLAAGFAHSGTELLCFHPPVPLPAAGLSDYPPLAAWLKKVRDKQDAPWIDLAASYSWDLPMLVANGLVDSIEIANSHFGRKAMLADEAGGRPRDRGRYMGPMGYARWSQDVYFKLLDCGLRLPPTAGSGSGVTPNPVGYNRVYVHFDGPWSYAQWWRHLRAGEVIVTNGPLMRPKINGELPGHVFQAPAGQELELEIGLTLSVTDPISYLDVIQDGAVRYNIRFEQYAASGRLPKLQFRHSGWCLLRAVCDLSDTYRFAMSGPFYVEIGDKPRISRSAAEFFLDWVQQRARQITLDDPHERHEVLEFHRQARDFWKDLVDHATAE